ncbi:hypothetical protein TKK_0007796 [Trichogramma kaykai]
MSESKKIKRAQSASVSGKKPKLNTDWFLEDGLNCFYHVDGPNVNLAHYSICKSELNGYIKKDLKTHLNTQCHKDAVLRLESETVQKLIQDGCSENTSLKKKRQNIELVLTYFMLLHNISIDVINDLVPMIKYICSNNNVKVVKSVKLASTKCSELSKNVLGYEIEMKIVKILQNNPFSILVDESTDISRKKYLCVAVRYLSFVGIGFGAIKDRDD